MYCQQTGKQKYATRHEAQVAMRKTIDRRHDDRWMDVYLCNHCSCFHFGRNEKKIRAGKHRQRMLYRAMRRYERLAEI